MDLFIIWQILAPIEFVLLILYWILSFKAMLDREFEWPSRSQIQYMTLLCAIPFLQLWYIGYCLVFIFWPKKERPSKFYDLFFIIMCK